MQEDELVKAHIEIKRLKATLLLRDNALKKLKKKLCVAERQAAYFKARQEIQKDRVKKLKTTLDDARLDPGLLETAAINSLIVAESDNESELSMSKFDFD